MKSEIRSWLVQTYIGPIVVALTLIAALGSFLKASVQLIEPLVSMLIWKILVREFGALSRIDLQISWSWIALLFGTAIAMSIVGLAIAFWMYPRTHQEDQPNIATSNT